MKYSMFLFFKGCFVSNIALNIVNKKSNACLASFNISLQWYEGHSISNAILIIIFGLNTLLKFDLAFLKHIFNSPSARQFNT